MTEKKGYIGRSLSRTPTFSDVFRASQTIRKYLKPTPLIYSRQLSRLLDCDVHLKLENLQPTRAFKVRGGVWYISQMKDSLTGEKKKKKKSGGVVTASTGNHAQSVAYAGSLFGVPVKVVMPEGVPAGKIEATKQLGAEVTLHGAHFEQAREYAEKIARDEGWQFVHSIDEPILYEGVGTMHLEVISELPDVQVVINPIGGGSGAASACIVYKSTNPKIEVIGVQAEGAPAFYESWKRGSPTSTAGIKTRAEGLATTKAYELPLRILRQNLDDIVLVSDAEMANGVRAIFDATRQVAELSGAASTAAAVKIKGRLRGKKVVLILTGGNIEASLLAEILK